MDTIMSFLNVKIEKITPGFDELYLCVYHTPDFCESKGFITVNNQK